MKKKLLTVMTLMFLGIAAFGQWSTDSVNTAGIFKYAAANGNYAVFSNGGEWNTFHATTGVHQFGNFAISRQMIEVVSLGDKVMFAGGKYGSFADPLYTKQVNVFNSTTNTWSTWNMGTAREVGGAAGTGNKVVFAGGTGRSDIAGPVYMYNKVDIFDINTGARSSGKLSKARTNIAAGAAGNKVVFVGGWYWDMMYSTVYSNKADIYDVSTGLWTSTTLAKKRDNISVAVVGDKIIFAGGTNNTGNLNTVDIYNATTNTWSSTTMPVAGYGFVSAVIGNEAFFTGNMGGAPEMVYRYNTVTNTWSSFALPTALSGFSCIVLDGRLIFAGGTIPATYTYSNLVQIFDPITNTWSTEYLSMARTSVSALSIGNKGYFAGGLITYGYPTSVYTRRVDLFAAPFRMGEKPASDADWQMLLYPNPANQYVTIAVNMESALPLIVQFVDRNGVIVFSGELYESHTRIDVNMLPSGMYMVRLIDAEQHQQIGKLIKK